MRLLALAITFALASIAAQAQVLLPASLGNLPSRGSWHSDGDFTADMQRARAMLATYTASFSTKILPGKTITLKVAAKKGSPTKVFRKLPDVTVLADYQILLAVKHVKGDQIQIVEMERDGDNALGYQIDWKKLNGVNTNFIVSKPQGYAVLAIKRVIRSGQGFTQAVYSPYSAEVDTPGMRATGLKYLRDVLESADADLAEQKVRSYALPGKGAADLVPDDVALYLSIIEHIDPARINKEPIESLINEVLVTVAANREMAYAFAVSKARARGLFQFIPSTYAAIVRKYPSAGLVPEFVAGMNAHVNAAKASLLLFDSDLAALPPEKRTELIANKKALAEYLAVAYNSGARRAVKAYADGTISDVGLPTETQLYLVKLRAVDATFRR